MYILGSHKARPCDERSRRRGATPLELPRYSSGFNPIEKAFSKLKWPLRKAAERTIDRLRSKIGEILSVTPQRNANLFAAVGCDPL